MAERDVFILGAGFSAALTADCSFTFPTVASMFTIDNLSRMGQNSTRIRQSVHDETIPWYQNQSSSIRCVIEELMGNPALDMERGWIDAFTGERVNFERVMTFCDSIMKDRSQTINSIHIAEAAFVDLIFALVSLLDVFQLDNRSLIQLSINLERFLTFVKAGSLLITTNYDNILEDTYFARPRNRSGEVPTIKILSENFVDQQAQYYSPKSLTLDKRLDFQFNVIKLHGSINWSECTRIGCTHNTMPQFRIDEFRALKGSGGWIESHCQVCGSRIQPAIFPPVLNKDYYSKSYATLGVSQYNWNTYFTERIVVIGYSFNENDYYIRSLLSRNFKDRENPVKIFEYVDRNPVVRKTIQEFVRRMGGEKVQFRPFASLDDWINGIETSVE